MGIPKLWQNPSCGTEECICKPMALCILDIKSESESLICNK